MATGSVALRRLPVLATALMVALATVGCGDGDGDRAAPSAGAVVKIPVVASFYPVFEAAQRVGGDRVEVTNLTAPGAEPHDLELTPKQVDLIEDADVVLYFGQGFQPAVEEVARRTKGKAVDLLRNLPLVAGAGEEHEEAPEEGADETHGDASGLDPHVWLDPVLMQEVVDRLEDALVSADPGGKAAYAANAEAYRGELAQLDAEYRAGLRACERSVVVTSHDAFGYLTRRYGLEQEAIAGLSPESEPDPNRLAELSDLVRRSGSTTVFYETLTSPRIAETLAREAGVKAAVLNPIEGLTDAELAAGEGYLSVMRENLAALKAALGCP